FGAVELATGCAAAGVGVAGACPWLAARAAFESIAFFCSSAFMVLRVLSMTSGFCAQAVPAAIPRIKIAVVSFIGLPYFFTGAGCPGAGCPGLAPAAGGSMSWLKNVVAMQVATTLSLAAY